MPSAPPETRYAKSAEVNIAYQVTGEGPLDLVLVPGFVSHLELDWEEPRHAHFLGRLASFSRLIRADMRRMCPGADEQMARWWAARAHAAASPGAARDLILMNSQIDVRQVLPAIQVPTLVLHRSGDLDSRPEEGRYIAERIPGARFV